MFFFRNKKRQQDKLVVRKKSSEIIRRSTDKPLKIARVIFYCLSPLFFLAAAYAVFLSPFLEIQKIKISGTSELSQEEVFNEVKSLYNGKYLKLIPKSNLILFSEKQAENSLLDHFRKIKSAEVKKIFPGVLSVRIEERKSLILWCSGEECFIIDEKGVAYTRVDLNSPEVSQNNLIKVVDTSARPVVIGEDILSEDYVIFLMSLREELKKNSDFSISGEWKTPSTVAEEAEAAASEGWRIYFSAKIPPAKSMRTLKTFLQEEMKDGKREKLEYADLRVENKVYFKLKEEEKKEEN